MIPAAVSQWPGLVIHLQATDQFAINMCNNFGLTLARGVYSMVANAGANIFRGHSMGPVAKWVDNHIFFHMPWAALPKYNKHHSMWHSEIQSASGCRQSSSCVWYRGKELLSGSPEEFDEDCSTPLLPLPHTPSCLDQNFHYAGSHIDKISMWLRICWEPFKTIPFVTKVPYLGFRWDLHEWCIYLPEEKHVKYLAAIALWKAVCAHNLLKTQKLYGKLLHATLVLPEGRAYLTGLEAMLTSFNNNPFILHTPPHDTPEDLEWWKQQLSCPHISIPISVPKPLVNYQACSNVSMSFSVTISIAPKWQAWKLIAGWKSQGRVIQWAEAISFKLLIISLCGIV